MEYRHCLLLPTLLALPAFAHHSFAPHFDAGKPVVLEGTVVEFEARNPHAYLHLEVIENGRPQVWVCESHGVTMLERVGLTREMLAKGAKLKVEGAAARRDAHGCFFRFVELADGTRVNVDGPVRAPADAPARAAVAAGSDAPNRAANELPGASLLGTWLIAGRRAGAGGLMSDYFTEAGRQASADYDPFTDDPVMRCDTIGIRRAWGAVGTPLEIVRDGPNRIKIRHEWMDAERTIHLDRSAPPPGFDATSLGYSVGRFEGDALVIDTVYARGGVVSQYQEMPDGTQIGLLHSAAMKTKERLWVDAATGQLNVTIDSTDPEFYTQPFPSATISYARTDLRVEPFGCTPRGIDLATPR